MRPQLCGVYERLVRDFRTGGWGIYDDTADMNRALCLPADMQADYLFHCAAVTRSAQMATDPVWVIDTSLQGTRGALEYAWQRGEPYNVVNPAAGLTIHQMAQTVADGLGGGRVKVVVDIPADAERLGYAAPTTARLSADKLQALGWRARRSLPDMYTRMLRHWAETKTQQEE